MQVVTSDLATVGTYNLSITVGLSDYPMVATVTKNFVITITCTVTTLAFTTNPPATTSLEVGVDPQPHDMTFSISKTPNCVQDPTFTLASTPAAAFASRTINVDGESGYVRVTGATLADIGTYSMTLTAVVDAQTTTNAFTVIILDPCKRAVFETSTAPLSTMTIVMPSGGLQTQTVKIFTDVERAYTAIVCPITAAMTAGSVFVNLSGDYATITVDKSKIILPTDIGTHTFTLIVNEQNWSSNVAQQSYSFDVVIVCTVTSLTITSQPADKNPFILNQGAFTTLPLQMTQTDACVFPFTYTHTYTKNGNTITQPSWLNFNTGTTSWTMAATAVADIGTYVVTTTSTIPQVDPGTGVNRIKTSSYTITVVSDCTISTITDRTVADMTYGVTLAAVTQNVFFLDSIATGHFDNDYCGPRTYTLSQTNPWLSIATDTMQVVTSDLATVGTYNLSITVGLTDYPMVPTVTKNFVITITCTVTTLAFTTNPPASTSLEVGVDPQPHDMTFSISKTPNCVQDPTFTLASTPAASFASRTINVDGESGYVRVTGATLADIGTYSMTLTAVVDAQTTTNAFTVIILDPCKRAIFETTPTPLSNMNIIMPAAGIETQAVKIYTDVERAYTAIVCPITASMTPGSIFVDLSGDFATITVDKSKIVLPTDIGTHTYTLIVNEKDWSSNVAQQAYSFDINIICTVSSLTITSQASNSNYILNQGTIVTSPLTITQASACVFPFTYTHTFTKNGSPIAQPAWITYSTATRDYSVTITSPADIGTYTVMTQSEIPQIDPGTGANRIITSSFTITVISDCSITSFEARVVTDMDNGVTLPAVTQNVFFTDTVSSGHGNNAYCGLRNYVLSPALSFMSITGDSLSVQTNNPADINSYVVTITATLVDYPTIPAISRTFNVQINCSVQTISFVAPLIPALTTVEVGIDAQPVTVPFVTSQFPNCGNAVTFSLVPNTDPFMSLVTNSIETGEWTVLGATIAHHGNYSYTLTASVDGKTATSNFQVFIKDPCSSSVFELVPSPLTDMSLILYYNTVETQTQSVKIWTDVERSHGGIVCPITATLSPSLTYISLAPDFASILVDGSQATDADNGLHTMTLTVDNLLFSSQVTQAVYTFVLDLQACVVNDFVFASTISSFTYRLTSPPVTSPSFLATQSNLNCLFPITYTASYKQGGLVVPKPGSINFDLASRTFTVSASNKAYVGTYTVDVTATIPQILQPSGTLSTLHSFDVTIESDCLDSVINDRVVNDMSCLILNHNTQDVVFTNTKASSHADPTHCGAYKYDLSPALSFVSVTGGILDVYTTDRMLAGDYTVTMSVSLVDFPLVPPIVKTISIRLICEITDVIVTKTPASTTFEIMTKPYLSVPYLVSTFPACQYTLTLDPDPSVYSFAVVLNQAGNEIVIASKDLKDEGVYPMKLIIEPKVGFSSGVSKTLTFTVELINICKTTSFDSFTMLNLGILKQSPEFGRDNFLPYSDLNTIAWKYGVDCGKVLIAIEPAVANDEVPTWIKLDTANQMIVVNVSKEQKAFFAKKLVLNAQLMDYPAVVTKVPFQVTVGSAGFSCLANSPIVFTAGDPVMQFGIVYANLTQTAEGMKLTQIIEPVAMNESNEDISLPGFITYKSMQFTIANPPYEQIGKYKFGIRLGFQEFPQSITTCTKTVTVRYETKFRGGVIPKLIMFTTDQPYELPLPEYTDVFGVAASIEVKSEETEDFFIYDPLTRRFKTYGDPKTLQKYAGEYKAKLIMTDSAGKSINYDLTITVTNLPTVEKKKTEEGWTPTYKLPPPVPRIQFVDMMGRVRVSFSRKIVVPHFGLYPEFKDDKHLRQNCTNGNYLTACDQTKADKANKVEKVETARKLQTDTTSEQARVEAMQIINSGLVLANRTQYPVIELDMVPGSIETNVTAIEQFTWECVDFKEEYMDFQIHYRMFPEVSIHSEKDLLQVNFIGREYFRTEDGQMIQETQIKQRKEVPTQVDPELGASMQAMGDAVGNAGKAMAIGNFVIGLFLGGILSELFAAMNKLQIMLHLLIVNVLVPVHAIIYFQGLLGLVTFQIYDFTNLLTRIFALKTETKIINQNLHYLGYQSTYFILNMGNIFLLLVLEFAVIGFIALTRKATNQRVIDAHNTARNLLIWNGIYKVLNEPYVVFVISCLTQTLAMTWDNTGEVINNILMFATLIVVIVFPFWTFRLLRSNKEKLNDKAFKAEFSSVYEQLKWKDGSMWTLAEPAISGFRMLLTCCALMYMQDYRTFQIIIAMSFHYFVLVYNGVQRPFQNRMHYFFQQFNEVFVFWVLCILMTFADLIYDQYAFDMMGWVLVFIVTANLVINFLYILGGAFFRNFRSWRIKYLKWKRARLRKSLERKYAEWELKQKQLLEGKHLSPRSMVIWNRLSKELGMEFDPKKIDVSNEYSFNSNAELCIVGKKEQAEDDLILAGGPGGAKNQRSRNQQQVTQMTAEGLLPGTGTDQEQQKRVGQGKLIREEDNIIDDELILPGRKRAKQTKGLATPQLNEDIEEDLFFVSMLPPKRKTPGQLAKNSIEATKRDNNQSLVSPLTQTRMDEFYGKTPVGNSVKFAKQSAGAVRLDDNEYAISPLTQAQMNEFYGKANNGDQLQSSQLGDTALVIGSNEGLKRMNTQQTNQTKMGAPTAMYIDSDTRFEVMNQVFRSYMRQPQDKEWGQGDRPYADQSEGTASLHDQYVQNSVDRDDQNAQSFRVNNRKAATGQAISSPSHARQLFDELWNSQEIRNQPKNHFHINIDASRKPATSQVKSPSNLRQRFEEEWQSDEERKTYNQPSVAADVQIKSTLGRKKVSIHPARTPQPE